MYQYLLNIYPIQILYTFFHQLFPSSTTHLLTKKAPITTTLDPNLKDFYFLSLIRNPDNNYTIHGLWPQTTLLKYPTYCRKLDFSLELLNPILDKLEQY